MNLTSIERLKKSRVQSLNRYPFFAFLMLGMNLKESKNNEVPTMGVNVRGDMYFNDEWVKGLTQEQVTGALSHEALHLSLGHLFRTEDRDKELWNMAVDLVCNYILVRDNFILPREGIIPNSNGIWSHTLKNGQEIKIENIGEKSAEQIYSELYNQIPKIKVQIKSGGGQGKGQKDDKKQGNLQLPKNWDKHLEIVDENGKPIKLSKKEADAIKEEWTNRLIDASTHAKQRGKLPAGIERYVKDLLEPEFNWRTLLYKYITNTQIYDYNMTMPSRKSRVTGIHLPSPLKEKIEVVVGIDVSGSVGQREYDKFIAEVIGIAKSFPNISMRFLPWDTSVTDDLEIANGNIEKILTWKQNGGGGTNINCVLDYVEEKVPDATLLVVLTDGWFGKVNKDDLPFDCVWTLTPNHSENNIPEGDIVIKMKEDER